MTGKSRRRPVDLDDIDFRLLKAVQVDCRRSNADLARAVDLSTSAVNARLARLRREKVIRAEVALVEPRAVALGLTAFIQVVLDRPEHEAGFVALTRLLDQVQECHHITGDFSYLLKIRCRDTAELEELLSRLKEVPGTIRTRSTIALSSAKETTALPLEGLGGDGQ